MLHVYLAPSADLAKQVVGEESVLLTVEAEYGSVVIEGQRYTAAHHQPAGTKYAGTHVGGSRRSPCNDKSITPELVAHEADDQHVILLSHVDLDSLAGCLRALCHPKGFWSNLSGGFDLFASDYDAFWAMVEHFDTQGIHKLARFNPSPEDVERLYAFLAWSHAEIPRFSRDKTSIITKHVYDAGWALKRIFEGDLELTEAGRAFRAGEQALNERTYVHIDGKIIVRVAHDKHDFCNHLYSTPTGGEAIAIASLNHENQSVTISLADPIEGVSCRSIVQSLWGPEAGGHDGIAGSPRERKMDYGDLERIIHEFNELLRSKAGAKA